MRYRNTKTGAVIDSASIIRGKNWVKVESTKSPKKEEVAPDLPILFEAEAVKPVKRTRKAANKTEDGTTTRKYTRKKKEE